ncbi:MAG: tetratricopeptide repeat protein [Anaerolineae bacterium]|nr:tetratricopeptide repeat protein [Anaerolineae bacterium]
MKKNGTPISNLTTTKIQALLAYLVTEAHQAHPRSRLANLLWPDQPERSALHSLRQALTTLRRAIDDQKAEPPFLLITRQTLQFNQASQNWSDCAEFVKLLQTVNSPNTPRDEMVEALQQAINLYQGDFLSGLTVPDSDIFENWLITNREHYQRETTSILERLSTYFETLGEQEEAISYTRRLIELTPWHESAHQRMMRCLAAVGRRNAALAHYETCRRILAEELSVEPMPETTALFEAIRSDTWPTETHQTLSIPARLEPPPTTAHHLPAQLTSFVGREAELGQLADYLIDPACRLVTLVGPGGIGKTRLALQAAEQHRDKFADGIHFVSLANINTIDLLPTAIGSVLELSFNDQIASYTQLLDYVQSRYMLLVLDNFEHLTSDLNLVIDLLRTAPCLKILVTSRERLNLQAEWIVEVKGLSYPSAEDMKSSSISHQELAKGATSFGATQLFMQRAKQVNPHFQLSPDDFHELVQLCRMTAGMPLALELAAAQVRQYTLSGLIQAMQNKGDRLGTQQLDIPQRHRNLSALFNSAWDKLEESERMLFSQLSIFPGSFDTDAAHAITEGSRSQLATLVDKSMLRQTVPGRYDIHPLLRQFGLARLRQKNEPYKRMKDKHCVYYATLLQQQEDNLTWGGPRQPITAVEQEIENIRAGWQWAVDNKKFAEIKQIHRGLFRLYKLRNWLQEGAHVFLHAVETLIGPKNSWPIAPENIDLKHKQLVTNKQVSVSIDQLDLKIELLLSLVYFTDLIADYHTALTAAQAAAKLAIHAGNMIQEIRSYLVWGNALWHRGRHKLAHFLFVQALTLARDNSNTYYEAESLQYLGNVYRQRGRHIIAREHYQKALTLYRGEGSQQNEAQCLSWLGYITSSRGDYATAQNHLKRAIKIYQRGGDRYLKQEPLRFLGLIQQNLGLYQDAQNYFQQVVDIAQEFGNRYTMALALSDWGINSCYLNNCDQAEIHCRDALAIARDIKDRYSEGYTSARLGFVLTSTGDLPAAAEAYRRAIHLRRKLGQDTIAILDLAELAWITMQRKQSSQALAQVDEILSWLESNDTTYFNELPRVYWRCYQILQATHPTDPPLRLKTIGVLDATYNVLQNRADRIENEHLRRSYLEQVAIHRKITQAWRAEQSTSA